MAENKDGYYKKDDARSSDSKWQGSYWENTRNVNASWAEIWTDAFTLSLTGIKFTMSASASLDIVVGIRGETVAGFTASFEAGIELKAVEPYAFELNATFASADHGTHTTVVLDKNTISSAALNTKLSSIGASLNTVNARVRSTAAIATRAALAAQEITLTAAMRSEAEAARIGLGNEVTALSGTRQELSAMRNEVIGKIQQVSAAKNTVTASAVMTAARAESASASVLSLAGLDTMLTPNETHT